MTEPVSYFPPEDPAARYLPARPEPIMIRPAETALIIVDMQNAYASPGGYLDIANTRFRIVELEHTIIERLAYTYAL